VGDKGKVAVVVLEISVESLDGTPLRTQRRSISGRGEGRFGGDREPSTSVTAPHRPCDDQAPLPTQPQRASPYRLCGAAISPHSRMTNLLPPQGFPVHYGTVVHVGSRARPIVDARLDDDVSRVGSYGARFAGVVFPG
jgi:hypothetical protein